MLTVFDFTQLFQNNTTMRDKGLTLRKGRQKKVSAPVMMTAFRKLEEDSPAAQRYKLDLHSPLHTFTLIFSAQTDSQQNQTSVREILAEVCHSAHFSRVREGT